MSKGQKAGELLSILKGLSIGDQIEALREAEKQIRRSAAEEIVNLQSRIKDLSKHAELAE